MIWVLCSGKWKDDFSSIEKPGALVRINPATNTVDKTLTFTDLKVPTSLSINASKDELVYIHNKSVYQQDITASSFETTAKINRSFYHFGIDPSSNILYATVANYTSNSTLVRYNNTFTKIDSCSVSVGAGEIFFNN